MLDFSWGEIIVIGAVALVVIGPKDLPEVLRTVGRWTSAARNMAREFRGHVDDMIRETEVDEIRKNIQEGVTGSLDDLAKDIDPDRSLRDSVDLNKYLPDGRPGDLSAAPPPVDPAEIAAAPAPPSEPAQIADNSEPAPVSAEPTVKTAAG